MRHYLTGALIASAGAAAVLSLAVEPARGQAAGEPRAYRAPRTADGKPDLNGIWQALNEAYWDIEAHSAAPGAVLELGASNAIPAGLGIVEGSQINPHSWFHVDVKMPDGTVVPWLIEGGSPNQLIRLGVTKNTLKMGTEFIIEGYQARDGTNKAVGRNFQFADGRTLFLGGSAPGAAGADKP